MNKNRLFTEGELIDLGKRVVDRFEQAIEQGDYSTAKKLGKRLHKMGQLVHDFYLDWLTGALSYIGRTYGDEVLYQAFEEIVAESVKSERNAIDTNCGTDARKRLEFVVNNLLQFHWQKLEITEEDDKFIIRMLPCGSGGRQIQRGKYKDPDGFYKVRKPQPMTCWKENMPVYCCHAHFMASLPHKLGLTQAWFEIPSDKPGVEPCEFWVYKDLDNIPDEAYKRTGVKKT